MDDLDIGAEIAGVLGIDINDKNPVDEKVGEERLGSGSPFSNFGATLMLGSILFTFFILILVVVILLLQRVKCSPKMKEKVHGLKRKVFYNPIIRYLLLNSLKLNLSAFMAFATPDKNAADILIALVVLCIVNIAPIICCIVIFRNRAGLKEDDNRKAFGTLYQGRKIEDTKNRIMLYPIAFFYRRTIFIIVTVFLFDRPAIQMILNQVLTIFMIIYLLYESKSLYASRAM